MKLIANKLATTELYRNAPESTLRLMQERAAPMENEPGEGVRNFM